MYQRKLELSRLLTSKSLFLLGPRQTGKSTLLKATLPEAISFNLLDEALFRSLISFPERLREYLPKLKSSPQAPQLVVIDEIQRIPSLLNEVQLLLDTRSDLRFVLTGSSARKLKRGHANLMGGRARFAQLHPLVTPEIGALRLDERILKGSLPAILDSPEFKEDLKAYVGGYLKEEIQAESLVRNIGSFARFLETAAVCNTEQLNFAQIGSDTGIPQRTVKDYFVLLEDTLIGNFLEPYSKTKKRKPVATPKFYFFDLGVVNALLSRFSVSPGTPEYGKLFEHFIYTEIRAWLSYTRSDFGLTYWRSQSGSEVDFLIGDHAAIEVKAKPIVTQKDLAGLRALKEEELFKKYYLVCLEPRTRITDDGIEVLPVEEFSSRLWQNTIA